MSFGEGRDDVVEANTAAPSLYNLPNSVLTTILECVVRCSSPGQLIKLSLACRALHQAVSDAEGLWEQLSVSLGWSRRRAVPRAAATPCAAPAHNLRAGPVSAAASVRDRDLRWFRYYSRRMGCRRSLRRFLRLYSGFLSRPSSLALMPGAEPAALFAAERRLGVELPVGVWELHRHRSGQAAGGPGVTFADDMRLLVLDELAAERHPGLRELRGRLRLLGRQPAERLTRPGDDNGGGDAGAPRQLGAAAAEAAPPAESRGGGIGGGRDSDGDGGDRSAVAGCGCGGGGGASPAAVLRDTTDREKGPSPALRPPQEGRTAAGASAAAAAAAAAPDGGSSTSSDGDRGVGPGSCRGGDVGAVPNDNDERVEDDGDDLAVVLASNPSSSRRLLVSLDGQVYLARGLSITFFAPSVAAMIQKLLQ